MTHNLVQKTFSKGFGAIKIKASEHEDSVTRTFISLIIILQNDGSKNTDYYNINVQNNFNVKKLLCVGSVNLAFSSLAILVHGRARKLYPEA